MRKQIIFVHWKRLWKWAWEDEQEILSVENAAININTDFVVQILSESILNGMSFKRKNQIVPKTLRDLNPLSIKEKYQVTKKDEEKK